MPRSQHPRVITTHIQCAVMQQPTPKTAESNLEEICVIALDLWQKAGRPTGRHLRFWLDAEQRVAARIARSAAAKTFKPG